LRTEFEFREALDTLDEGCYKVASNFIEREKAFPGSDKRPEMSMEGGDEVAVVKFPILRDAWWRQSHMSDVFRREHLSSYSRKKVRRVQVTATGMVDRSLDQLPVGPQQYSVPNPRLSLLMSCVLVCSADSILVFTYTE